MKLLLLLVISVISGFAISLLLTPVFLYYLGSSVGNVSYGALYVGIAPFFIGIVTLVLSTLIYAIVLFFEFSPEKLKKQKRK